jgi:ribosomal protein S18 acetylase RimI-like enzyme
MPTLRRASDRELDGIVSVFLDCWRVSYSQVMPAALVDGMTPERAMTIWRNALQNPDNTIVVAIADEPAGAVLGLVGYSMLGSEVGQSGVGYSGVGYVGSLYVSPFAQGSGTGRLLLSAATDDLKNLGAQHARLWVFEQNAPSRAFYERQGWTADGRREVLAEWGEPQIGMTKDLRA